MPQKPKVQSHNVKSRNAGATVASFQTPATEREAGVVSIVVTMVAMIVLSLVVMGFADIARNEQRSTIDSQLSSQAFYAAESGVNDAIAAMNSLLAAGTPLQNKTTCGNQGNYTLGGTVDAAHNVSYTCVLIDAEPDSLSYNVGYTSTVIPVLSSGSAYGSLTLRWRVPSGVSGSAAGCYTDITDLGVFPVATGAGQWNCDYPVLRVDLLDANGALARADWPSDTSTTFFVPFNSSTVTNNTTMAARGAVVPARCNAMSCTADITGLGGTRYYMRVTTLYRTNSLLSITSSGASFTGTQVTIDSTGKAQDVLRRIRVTVDLTGANARLVPSGALATRNSVCKRYGVTNSSLDIYDNQNPAGGGAGNSLCSPTTLGVPVP